MKYKVTVISVNENQVVLRYDNHEIIAPKIFFDEKVVVGAVWYFSISQTPVDNVDEKQLAKDILNEILNTEES